jgi:hypothetical protein
MLWGPWTQGAKVSYEYWLFRPRYRPELFSDLHVQRAYKNDKPLTVSIVPLDLSSERSQELVVDAGRRLAGIEPLLPKNDPALREVIEISVDQLTQVETIGLNARLRGDAETYHTQLKQLLQSLPPYPPRYTKLPGRNPAEGLASEERSAGGESSEPPVPSQGPLEEVPLEEVPLEEVPLDEVAPSPPADDTAGQAPQP